MKPITLAYFGLAVLFILGLWLWLDAVLRFFWELSGVLTRLGQF